MTRNYHPSKTFTLKPWRKAKMETVNTLVRFGWTQERIAAYLNTSTTTVQRYYYGFGDNCLTTGESVIYLGASVDLPGSFEEVAQ